MDYSFWFYTLSAIPQTLGAIIALTATFIVFKLNRINDSISSHYYHLKIILRAVGAKIPKEDKSEKYISLFSGKNPILDINNPKWIDAHFIQLEVAYRIIVHDPSLSFSSLNKEQLQDWFNYQIAKDFIKKLDDKDLLLSYLWKTLILVSFTIIFCLFLLPLVLNDCLRLYLIPISIGLAGGSITATIISIRRIVKL